VTLDIFAIVFALIVCCAFLAKELLIVKYANGQCKTILYSIKAFLWRAGPNMPVKVQVIDLANSNDEGE